MAKLSDIQHSLLVHAASRPNGSPLPPPETLDCPVPRIRRTLSALLKLAFLEEVATAEPGHLWREDGGQTLGLRITQAGFVAVGVEAEPVVPVMVPAAPTKIGHVLALLQRDGGATMPELIAATGWLAHTTRAALTGLRKKGHAIATGKRGDATCYSLQSAA